MRKEKMKVKCRKIKTKSIVPNHNYSTRFRLRCASAAYLSFDKVTESDHGVETQLFVLCKRKKVKAFLPKDIIFNILVYLPAKILFEMMRFVCLEWYHMVKEAAFVTAHLQVSPIRVLAQRGIIEELTYYVEANDARLTITELGLPFPAKLSDSVNGLILLRDLMDPEVHYVVNLVTGVIKTLPRFGHLIMTLYRQPFPTLERKSGFDGFIRSALSCTSGGHYKVVCVIGDVVAGYHVLVCTVGVDDAWRVMEHISHLKAMQLFVHCRHSIPGFIFWLQTRSYAMDVDTEKIYTIDPPENCGVLRGRFIKMLTTLGYIIHINNFNGGVIRWVLWELTDIKGGGKWSKVFDINMGGLSSRLVDSNFGISSEFKFCPRLYLTNGDLWICLHSKVDETCCLAIYNIRSGNLLLSRQVQRCLFLFPHVNSLVKSC